VALMFVSAALLVLSRLEHETVKHARWQMTEMMAPVLGEIAGPLEHVRRAGRTLSRVFDLEGEVAHLEAENQRLKGWEWRAIEAERKLADLSQTSNAAREHALSFVTSRVIAHSGGPFVRSAMVSVGRGHGVKTGYPVLSGEGLVGRIVETGEAGSEVLLLTDLNSRIPVYVGRSSVRAVMAGDNGPRPRLTFLPSGSVEPGDEVATSGVGGLFPRGLRIGVVERDGPVLRVRPHAGLDRLEYVSVIFYDNPTLGLIEGAETVRGARLSGGDGEKAPASRGVEKD
jgi:rod shape-determining protein MreC